MDSQESTKAKRAKDGRFLPGHKPPKSPGRPRGPNGIKARASRLAGERLEQMLGKAAAAIDAALDDGDTQVATWLIDRVRPPRQSDFITPKTRHDLETVEDIVLAGRDAVIAAGAGEMSLTEARAYIDLLTRLGGLQGYLELEKVKKMLNDVQTSPARRSLGLDQSHLPPESRLKWGMGISTAQDPSENILKSGKGGK